jgi:outer membrane protein assembly factor BamB
MMRCFNCRVLLIGVLLVCLNAAHAENWPCWRGPRGDGTSLDENVPTQWDAATNVVWKTAVPGIGHASPIVWGDRIFTATAAGETKDRVLLCFDRNTGEMLWQKTVLQASLERVHRDNSYASGTPATDGEKVYVSFLDGPDVVVAAYDFSGNQVWLVRPGTFSSPHGYSCSPVLYKDKVIINGSSKKDAFVVALSRQDGRVLWNLPLEKPALSYSTPLIGEMAGRAQMIFCGNKSVAGYDPEDGSRIWWVDGPSDEFVATPTTTNAQDWC